MKVMIRISSVFVLFVIVVSCATTPSTLPDKYNFDIDLEAVGQIITIKSPSLEQVDNQSIILKVNWDKYYLLVLRRAIDSRYSNPNIGISRTISSITAGIDRVFVVPSEGTQSYVIERIYKLEGKEQAKEIKERLCKS